MTDFFGISHNDAAVLAKVDVDTLRRQKLHIDREKAFAKGLDQRYNLCMEDVQKNFYYAGGDNGDGEVNELPAKGTPHNNYWILRYGPSKERPDRQDKCCCGTNLRYNCYITSDDETFYVVGSCCIKHFLPNSSKTCDYRLPNGSMCMEQHNNRKYNLCNTHKKEKEEKERRQAKLSKVKTCPVCEDKHKAQTTLCQCCRKTHTLCPKCNEYKRIYRDTIYCNDCNFKYCRQCDVPKNNSYKFCFLCNKLNKMEK